MKLNNLLSLVEYNYTYIKVRLNILDINFYTPQILDIVEFNKNTT